MTNLGPAASLRLVSSIQAGKAATWLFGGLGDLLAQTEQPKWRDDPYPLYERIRQKGPLYRGLAGVFATAHFDTANKVLRDRRFGMKRTDGTMPGMGALTVVQSNFPDSFLDQDPPDHTRLRRLAAPAFNPKRVDGYRDRIQASIDTLVDAVEGKESFDVMADLATPLPIAVISDLLGIPEADRADFGRYGALIGQGLSQITSVRQAKDLVDIGRHLIDLFDRLMRERAKDPGEDVISALTVAVGEDRLTPEELHGTTMLLLIAGFETTVNLIGNGTRALLAHPEQWAQLRADPAALAAGTVEEVLRYDAPVQSTVRIAHEEVVLGDQTVKPNQVVGVIIGGANRDPEAYDSPDRFDITRTGGPEHLSFSSGIHYCLGARLARIEGELMFRTLAERLPLLRQAGPLVRREANSIRGLASFPVTAKVPAQRRR
ncbi:cytochrome P450 [Crossiella equi]|uniref:Cytochrome P450 n=1 Tax=Crossiella equi TaxID=130796 RepID=A0ABS5ACR9_9PSEU|nr:cytochrome P450 [Crossiella equi]MBP2474378.1 cytochrome P450 [Crossiella equi]